MRAVSAVWLACLLTWAHFALPMPKGREQGKPAFPLSLSNLTGFSEKKNITESRTYIYSVNTNLTR